MPDESRLLSREIVPAALLVLLVADSLFYYLAIRFLTYRIVHPKNLDKA